MDNHVNNSDRRSEMFSDYPDIVSVDEVRKMLNIGRNAAYRLLQDGTIKSFKIGSVYKIPKIYIIDYVLQGAC
jgi:excisionase family DNA binding protein